MEDQEITAVRDMTDDEYDRLYWPVDNMGRATVIELEDGTRLFASCDMEGNRAGFFWGMPEDNEELIGATIESVQPMSDAAMERRGWGDRRGTPAPPVLTLSTGHQVYPAHDGEGNAPGALFGFNPDDDGGETFTLTFS